MGEGIDASNADLLEVSKFYWPDDERLRASEAKADELASKLAEAEDALARSKHECQELRGHVEAVLTSAARVHAEKAGAE